MLNLQLACINIAHRQAHRTVVDSHQEHPVGARASKTDSPDKGIPSRPDADVVWRPYDVWRVRGKVTASMPAAGTQWMFRSISRNNRLFMLGNFLFKQFNDTYGHGAGDKVLQAVGRLLKARVRAEDVVCRYGGEEFVVMPGASLETMQSRAETLRREAAHLALDGLNPLQTPITLSGGIAVFPDHGEGWEAVLAAADAALYRAKHKGRDRAIVAWILKFSLRSKRFSISMKGSL